MTALLRAPLHAPSHAVGENAVRLELMKLAILAKLQESWTLGVFNANLAKEVQDTFQETSIPDWDGFRALPISPVTRMNVEAFIRALPLGSPRPSIGAEPDGFMTIEWYRSTSWTLSVSINEYEVVHFASIRDGKHEHGSFVFQGKFSEGFLNLVHEFAR